MSALSGGAVASNLFTGASTWYGFVNQNGNYSILARLCDLTATGTIVRQSEGPCIKQADISTVICKVYDQGTNKDNLVGSEILPDPTISAVSNFYDTLQTLGWPTAIDPDGYNFRLDLGARYCNVEGDWFKVEVKITLTSGSIVRLRVLVKVRPEQTP